MKLVHKPQQIPFIRKLCAHLSEEEIEEAEARFMQYVAICRDIAESEIARRNRDDFDKTRDQS